MVKKCKNRIRFLISCILLLSLFTLQVFASEPVDPEKPARLTIHTQYGSTDPISVAGVPFNVYRIAEVDADYGLTLTEDFKDCGIRLKTDASAEWDDVARLMKGYTQANKLEPTYTVIGGSDGKAVLENIQTGLYLFIGEKTIYNGYIYTVTAGLVSVPGIGNGVWDYDITVIPKVARETVYDPETSGSPVEAKLVDRVALKIWEDDGFEDLRPEEISVQLLRNGDVYDTVVLSGENNWTCEWRDLIALDEEGIEYEWDLIEDPVEGYTPTMIQNGVTFVLTNTCIEEMPEDPVPLGPAEPPEDSDIFEELDDPDIPLAGLPQTGMLWWPVPALLCLGIMFLIAGTVSRRREDE